MSQRGRFYRLALCALVAGLTVAGCSASLPGGDAAESGGAGKLAQVGTPGPLGVAGPTTATVTSAGPGAGGLLKLEAGDKIKVTVFGEDKISGEYELDPSGYLSLPLAGTVKAAGSSKVELEQALTSKLKSNYLRDPKVTVDVVSYRPIYVLGEVQKPGEYPYKSGLNVMSAVAVAGGSTYRASNSRVLIQRFEETALREYAFDPSIQVMPGDVVRLPERYF